MSDVERIEAMLADLERRFHAKDIRCALALALLAVEARASIEWNANGPPDEDGDAAQRWLSRFDAAASLTQTGEEKGA
jgi:hypothetical protein